MGDKTKLDLNKVKQTFQEEIEDKSLSSTVNPFAIFVTGISGSGKSTLINTITSNAIKIQSDNYRKLHPNKEEIKEKYGREEAYKRTSRYSFEFAKALRLKAIEHKLNTIFEATFSKVGTANDLIKPFLENGYQVVIVKLPIDIELSVQRNVDRYKEKLSEEYTIPRITSREDIEKMAIGYKQTLTEMEKIGIKIIDGSELKNFLANQKKIELSERLKENLNTASKKLNDGKKHSLNNNIKMKI